MQIEFEIDGMRLTRTSEAYVTEGSKNFIRLLFTFSSDWDDVQKRAVFARDNATYEVEIVDGACIAPYEVARTAGQFQLTVVGKDEDNDVIATTGDKTVRVSSNEFEENPSGTETRLTNTFLVDTLADVKKYAEEAAASIGSIQTSETNAKTSEDNAKKYAEEAAASIGSIQTSETNAKTSEDNAKISEQAASASATASASASVSASNSAKDAQAYAEAASASADIASVSAASSKDYMEKAKDYSENVNVFIPSISSDGVISWTNKAGLENPASVSVKGDKGDKGEQGIQGIQGLTGATGPQGEKGDKGDAGTAATITIGTVTKGDTASVTNVGTTTAAKFNFVLPKGDKGDKGDTGAQGEQGEQGAKGDTGPQGATGAAGAAATVTIGTVTTGEAGTDASVINSGTTSAAVLNFIIPRGANGADGGIEVDDVLSSTSTNPVQNKVITAALNAKADISSLAAVATSGSYEDLSNTPTIPDVSSFAQTGVANTWSAWQKLQYIDMGVERYTTTIYSGISHTPATSDCIYTATGAFTLDMSTLAGQLDNSTSMVFSATFSASSDYTLTISNAGTLKYLGSASDLAITSAGLLLNIKMCKDANGDLTSYVQGVSVEG